MLQTKYSVFLCFLISINCTNVSISEFGKGTVYRTVNIGNIVNLNNNVLSPKTNSIKQVIYSSKNRQISVVENLPELRSIYIERVEQQIIPEFKNVPKLSDVYMQSNDFVFIKKENFGYTNAVYIFLRFNSVYQIEDGSFGPKVKHVYLQCNNIRHVSPEWFQNPAVVNVLDLDENDIEYLQEGTFKDFKKLEYLYLVANGLKRIGDNAFSGTNFISELWLGSNEITELPATIFGSENVVMERLDISYNKLTFLTKDFLKQVNVTVSISLDDNPWQCSCYYYHILDWAGSRISSEKARSGEPRCVGEYGPISRKCKYWVDKSIIDIYRKEVSPPLINRDIICTRMIV